LVFRTALKLSAPVIRKCASCGLKALGEPLRTLYAFNPLCSAILLIGGEKTGDNRWYEKFVPVADRLFERHLLELAAMPLDQLRKAQQMTQLQVAEILGVNQGEVSKIEHRSDICVSTLAEYIEAMGGRLEIRAVFKDREVRITQFEELAS
jgi:predicted XRE-type DNA-binding protein